MSLRRALVAPLAAVLASAVVPPAASDVVLRPVAEAAFPTNLAPLPDGGVLFTEKETGRVGLLSPDGRIRAVAELPVLGGAERGLLGIAVHPDFPREPWVYLYLSDPADGRNRLLRLELAGGRAVDREVLLDLLPAVSGYHNGGDLAFGTDGMLYAATGEAHEPARAQDPDDLGGKVLRLAPDGSVPSDNPFPGSPVFSLGHRNSFGLCVNPGTGDVWETENGPDRLDEVNLLRPGGNHGWPIALGDEGGPDLERPALVFPEVIVPTGCAFSDARTMWFGDFHGALHRVTLGGAAGDRVLSHRVVATADAGITDVAAGPDGSLYVATATGILRVTGVRSVPAATPTGPDGTAPTGAPTGTPGAPSGTGVLGAAIVLGLLLAALVWSGRRLRRP